MENQLTRRTRAAFCRKAALCRQSAAIEEKVRFWRLLDAKFIVALTRTPAVDLSQFCAAMRGSLTGPNPFDGGSQFRLSTRLCWLREWRKSRECRNSERVN